MSIRCVYTNGIAVLLSSHLFLLRNELRATVAQCSMLHSIFFRFAQPFDSSYYQLVQAQHIRYVCSKRNVRIINTKCDCQNSKLTDCISIEHPNFRVFIFCTSI